jgi:hypothetical protein
MHGKRVVVKHLLDGACIRWHRSWFSGSRR